VISSTPEYKSKFGNQTLVSGHPSVAANGDALTWQKILEEFAFLFCFSYIPRKSSSKKINNNSAVS
jgi:hypothetical protein